MVPSDASLPPLRLIAVLHRSSRTLFDLDRAATLHQHVLDSLGPWFRADGSKIRAWTWKLPETRLTRILPEPWILFLRNTSRANVRVSAEQRDKDLLVFTSLLLPPFDCDLISNSSFSGDSHSFKSTTTPIASLCRGASASCRRSRIIGH